MVRYCVMWKFKPSDGKTPKELAEDVKEKYESLLGLVPGLTSIEVGVNRNEGKTSYDAVMIADFDSWEALAAYKADTMRDNVIEYVKTIAEVRAKVEYEREYLMQTISKGARFHRRPFIFSSMNPAVDLTSPSTADSVTTE